MKVLLINHHTWSRSSHRAAAFASQLVGRGFQVTLLVISDHNRKSFATHFWQGVEVVHSPDITSGRLRSGWDPLSVFRRLVWLLRNKERFDLVHLFETRPATIIPGLIFAWKRRIPIVIDWIDWWGRGGLIVTNRPRWYRFLFGWIETFFEEYFRRFANATTVISDGLVTRGVGLGIRPSSIYKIHPGLDFGRFKFVTVADARLKLNYDTKSFVVGFGSQDSFFDLVPVLDALMRLKRRHQNVRFLILGRLPERVLLEINSRNLQDSVDAPGFVPDADYADYLSCSDVFVMPFPPTPTNIGRWPNKFHEYLACGRPIVFNAHGDLGQFTNQPVPGIACEFESDGFYDALESLYQDPSLRAELGDNARLLAENKFQWSEKIDDLISCYQSVVRR